VIPSPLLKAAVLTPSLVCGGCRLRQKYDAWSKQFKQRMREAQAALRRRQGGSAGLGYMPSTSSMVGASSLVSHDSQDMGVPGVHSMIGHTGGEVLAVPKPPPAQQQQQRPAHLVHAHAAPVAHSGPDAAVTVAAPVPKAYKAPHVNVRKMPDLNAPDLLGSDRTSDGGSDGGRKKKGNVFSRVFG